MKDKVFNHLNSHFQKITKRKQFDDHEEEDYQKPVKVNFRNTQAKAEFRCVNCGMMVGIPYSGSKQRNHCPNCLHSLHVDLSPGDRSANCGSVMEPISIWVRKQEWAILHRCKGCGVIHSNRIASDDNEMMLLFIASQAIAKPPFMLYDEKENE
ncbi:RNHCP domain-containing protein [Leptospira sp. GIMC2001]|uniref:RNHCP domain-containing protein n=1 Tax=Leptospira sp. GIMC2001 TaxID=1513297 RepID=UPI0023497A54|nr:RNHCP domain-containing protein [Leptospira sp. GIMC2001]WCL50064.1 RNHCP domain-containing protein [Leptospira sp. GIMC2001]